MEPNQANAKLEKTVAHPIIAGWGRHWLAVLVAFTCLSVDLFTKAWARSYLPENESLPFLPPLLKLTRVTNSGAAFSLGHGNGQAVALISSLVFVGLLAWSIKRYRSEDRPLLEEIGIAMVLGSAFGNLLERYYFGRVTDFLEFQFIHFPIFNVADLLIDVGIGLILITMLSKKDG
ncbi:MAG: signal peptidase II [Candidatus Melainabacteria bacterium]|nr:MAG: signal peptidase II [Candidatus Melainabacteria bacterium]